jgi:hypothetical protein
VVKERIQVDAVLAMNDTSPNAEVR